MNQSGNVCLSKLSYKEYKQYLQIWGHANCLYGIVQNLKFKLEKVQKFT